MEVLCASGESFPNSIHCIAGSALTAHISYVKQNRYALPVVRIVYLVTYLQMKWQVTRRSGVIRSPLYSTTASGAIAPSKCVTLGVSNSLLTNQLPNRSGECSTAK